MSEENKNANIMTVSEETQIDLPPTRKLLPVDYKDWKRIKKDINDINFRSSGWENAGWSMLAMASALIIPVLTTGDGLKYKEYFISAAIGSISFMIVLFIVARSFNSSNKDSKGSVIDYMNEIEEEIKRRSAAPLDKKLNIIKASYGIEGSEFNITEELNDKIINDTLEIIIDNNIKGDPAEKSKKRAIIEYSFSGKIENIEVEEHGLLKLP
ncbi:MAG: hypothetical protein PHP52_13295 [Bacteroidales bacterium]|nr:hypothetical protein [Bacteroidales bacterium]